jgi:YHS domain-containing protein
MRLEQRQPPPSQRIQEPDTLIQDPVCGTFIPRKEALKVVKDGKEYFFCSEGCLKRFRRGGS